MNCRGPRPARPSRPQGGYALLFAVFLAATMFVFASLAAPSIINQARRQREQDLIWRGKQYVRGIRLYFQKNGRFPQNKEELIKGTLDVHFVRKDYSDPVGPRGGDADWRFIYVAPSGQLTGSVRYHTLQEMAAQEGGGQNAASLAALFGGPSPAQGGGRAGAPQAGAGRGDAGRGAVTGARGGPAAGAGGGPATAQSSDGLQPAGSGPTPVPLQAVDGPVLGASLIGVASKVKKDSLLVYQGKDTYFEWEFIWNPLLGRGPGGTPGSSVGTRLSAGRHRSANGDNGDRKPAAGE